MTAPESPAALDPEFPGYRPLQLGEIIQKGDRCRDLSVEHGLLDGESCFIGASIDEGDVNGYFRPLDSAPSLPEGPDPEKGKDLDGSLSVAEPSALRDAVERFLEARDGLDNIPDGEAGDIEIGRRAELASGLHEDMDAAIADMREALEAKSAEPREAEPSPSSVGVMKKALEAAAELLEKLPFGAAAEMAKICRRALAEASREGV